MPCRGLHFSLSDHEVKVLRDLPVAERVRHATDVIEETYFQHYSDRLAESDKAWDAIHRALTERHLTVSPSTHPLNLVVLGGETLCGAEDHLLSLKTVGQVDEVAKVLPSLTKDVMRRRYQAIGSDYGRDLDDVDFEYTWDWFQNVGDFWLKAAAERRSVLFSVSQ